MMTTMVRLVFLPLLLFAVLISFAQTTHTYNGGGADPRLTTSWTPVAPGSNGNFNSNNRVYLIPAGVTAVLSTGTLSISGTGTKLQVAGTLQTTQAITISSNTIFRIDNGGTYIHDNTSALSSTIFQGTESFGPSSTFQINKWQNTSTSITPASLTKSVFAVDGNNYYYGNLIINWAGSGTWTQGWPAYPTSTFLAAGDFTLTNAFNGTFKFSSSNNVNPDVYVAGSFNMNASGTIDFGSGNNSGGYLNVIGNISQTSGTLTSTGSGSSLAYLWAYYAGSSDWSFTGGTRTFCSYVVDLNKTVRLTSNFYMGSGVTGAKMVINSNATLDAQNYIISDGTSGAYVYVNGTLRTSNTNGLWTSGQTNRTISNTNALYPLLAIDSKVEYYGAAGQIVSSLQGITPPFDSYENLTISGANSKTLEGSTLVYKVFDFSATGNYLNIQNNILRLTKTASISNASATSYFIVGSGTGRLRQDSLAAATDRLFPIGTASDYLPVTIKPVVTGNDFSVNVFTGATSDGVAGGAAWPSKGHMVDAVWHVDKNTGTSDAEIQFGWPATLEGTGPISPYFDKLAGSDIAIWQAYSPYNSLNWRLAASGFSSDNTTNISRAISVPNAYFNSPFIVGWSQKPLPVEISFNAERSNGYNQLNWMMNNILGVKYFVAERSTDGQHFVPIAKKNTEATTRYRLRDDIDNRVNYYYRIKVVSENDNIKYSDVVLIKGREKNNFLVIGNPVQEQLVIQHPASDKSMYRVFAADGRMMKAEKIAAGALSTFIDVGQLKPGIYFIQYNNGETTETETFIKQ
jgi:hypothetical protein